jgi:LysR family glycine cleavage system transcriptional activator
MNNMLRLPDLDSFRFFEASARLGSFTKAANELCVTQAAVSQQIKNLENRLGVKLFIRKGRGLVLSEHGELILPNIQSGLDHMQRAVRKIERYQQPNVLSVTMLPSFASRWLVPRLWRFNRRCPDVELRVNPTSTQVDMLNSDIDLAIRLGDGNYPGLVCDPLMIEYAYAAACPQIASRIRCPDDVFNFMMVHGYVNTGMHWENWVRKAGVQSPRTKYTSQVINEGSLIIEMLLSGHGVAVVRNTLARGLVENGQLVPLLGITIDSDFQYDLVHREDLADNPNLIAFKQWLCEEADAFNQAYTMGNLFKGTANNAID